MSRSGDFSVAAKNRCSFEMTETFWTRHKMILEFRDFSVAAKNRCSFEMTEYLRVEKENGTFEAYHNCHAVRGISQSQPKTRCSFEMTEYLRVEKENGTFEAYHNCHAVRGISQSRPKTAALSK